jgi:uncharacterized protein involved in exopolysaccharide biosynthesis
MEDKQLNGIDILEYFGILLKWRKFIAICVLAVALVAVVISFLLPKWYKATATLMPPNHLWDPLV